MTMTETRPRPRRTGRLYTSQEVLEACDISFRILDYWLRTKAITLSCDSAPGSGHRRRFTASEVEAIQRLVTRYKAANEELDAIRSGRAWTAESVA